MKCKGKGIEVVGRKYYLGRRLLVFMCLIVYNWLMSSICGQNRQNKNANCPGNKRLAFCEVLEAGLEPARRLNAKGF